MIRVTHLLVAGAVALALCDSSLAQEVPPQRPAPESPDLSSIVDSVTAQEASSALSPLPGSPDVGVGGGVLEALPRPRDIPRSLFGPEQPPSSGGIQIDAPYFTPDPLLDFAPMRNRAGLAGLKSRSSSRTSYPS